MSTHRTDKGASSRQATAAEVKHAPRYGVGSDVAWGAVLFTLFLGVVLWFGVVDVYHRHFFDRGIFVFTDNLARTVFLFILAWLIYAPGVAVAHVLLPNTEAARLTPAERSVLAFGIGVGLWHVLLLILGVAGFYYRSAMVGLAATVLLASARHFAAVASATCRTLAAVPRQRTAIPAAICITLIAICGAWLLLVRGLYPGGGGDYATHYFYYYLEVLKNHGLSPNDVWYHYYYSKGYGLFFFGMLVTDPEAPALVTFCCVMFAAVAIAALAHRIAPGSLWPGCVAALYLLSNLLTMGSFPSGDFQKDHEQVSALIVIVLVALAFSRTRGLGVRAYFATATSSAIAVAIIAQPIGLILSGYFILVAAWAMCRGRWPQTRLYGFAGAAVGGTVIAICALNYEATGLVSDQALDLMLRFADITRLDSWGVLPQVVIVAWIRDNYAAVAPGWGWPILTTLREFTRVDQLWVFLAGPTIALWVLAVRVVTKTSRADASSAIAIATLACAGGLLAAFLAVSVAAARTRPVSFGRSSSFFFPVLLILATATCGWVMMRTPGRWDRRFLGWLLPVVLLSGTVFQWRENADWVHRLARASHHGLRFLTGRYSIAEGYSHPEIGPSGINQEALMAREHVGPDAPIWSPTGAYCMAPGCWIESVVSFKMSGHLDEILAESPERAKQLLQEAGLSYFLVLKDARLLDLLPYSKLFAPDTIGQYLGIKWTDGSAFLLTWIGPETTLIGPEFLKVYTELLDQAELLDRPEMHWFQFSRLAPQMAVATTGLRSKAWGAPAEFPWRMPPPDETKN